MRYALILSAVSFAALAMGLAACNPAPGTTASNSSSAMAALDMPLTAGPETPVAPAPSASALPRASAPVRVVRVTRPEDSYAYVDRAYAMSDAFGDAPPDYGYDYGPTHLWAWRAHDDSVRLVEPIDGGDRYYYYRPGRSAPYLVRDYDNSYGYDDDGDLVVVYDRSGRPLPYTDRYADRAARELARARDVYAAALNSERHEVRAANWAARRSQIDAARADWAAQAARQSEWRAYRDAHAAETAAYWRGEQDQRARQAQAFNDWQRQAYRGPLPTTGNQRGFDPAAQQASVQAHQQAEARLAALKQQQKAQAEEARRKQIGAQQASQQASAQAHQQAEARLAALKQQQKAQAEEARRKQLGAQQASQQASAQAHQQAEARLAALKQQQKAQAEEARRKQLGAQQASAQAHRQAEARLAAAKQQQHAEAEARQKQQLAAQQEKQQKVLAAKQQARQQAVARQKAHPDPAHNPPQHGQGRHPDKPGKPHGDERQ